MSSVVSALTGGGSGGGAGMGFQAGSANILNPATVEQANQQYANVNTGLANQQGFLNAVQAQNGLGNQSSVFNQMQGVANGTGPNPAQAMLANSTGANVANQAALMAGQRGASSNVGLMSRQAAQQGANTQQQAAGQGAALQANQSLGALNSMGSLATNQANQQANATNAYTNSALQGQQNILGGIGAQNNANVGMQSNINSVNGGLAQNVSTQQGNMLGNVMGGAGSALQMVPSLFGGGGSSGAATVAGGAMDAGSGVGDLGTMFAANGGVVRKPYADGGEVTELEKAPTGPQSAVGKSFMQSQDELGAYNPSQAVNQPMAKGSGAKGGGGMGMPDPSTALKGLNIANNLGAFGDGVGDFFGGLGDSLGGMFTSAGSELGSTGEALGAGIAGLGPALPAVAGGAGDAAVAAAPVMLAAQGGKVPAMVSPGERYLPPKAVEKVAKGANPMQEGEKIPGKAKVKGAKNSYANDTVPKTLEEGGIVLPRSVTQAKNPHWAAHAFVSAIMKEQALKGGGKKK